MMLCSQSTNWMIGLEVIAVTNEKGIYSQRSAVDFRDYWYEVQQESLAKQVGSIPSQTLNKYFSAGEERLFPASELPKRGGSAE